MKTRKRKSEGTDEGSALTREWVLVLAAVLSGVAAIVNVVTKVPTWFWGSALGLIALTAVGPAAWAWVFRLRSASRQWKAATRFIPEFHDFVRTFRETWSQTSIVTLRYEVGEAVRRLTESRGAPDPYTLNALAEAAAPFLLSRPKNFETLEKNVRLFEGLMCLLKAEYIERPLRVQKALRSEGRLPAGTSFVRIRQEFPQYQKFMMDYTEWAKHLNMAVGERISRMDYYAPGDVPPEELSDIPPESRI